MRLAMLALALGLPFVVYVGGNAAHQASIERDVGQRVGDVVSPAAYAQIGPAFVSGDRSPKKRQITASGIRYQQNRGAGVRYRRLLLLAAFCL